MRLRAEISPDGRLALDPLPFSVVVVIWLRRAKDWAKVATIVLVLVAVVSIFFVSLTQIFCPSIPSRSFWVTHIFFMLPCAQNQHISNLSTWTVGNSPGDRGVFR